MQNIKNIIFDYGNVVFDIDFGRAQQAFVDLGVTNIENLYAHHGQDGLFDDFDKGLIDAPTFREGIRQLAQRPDLSDEEIDAAWNALLLGVPPINHLILQKYKERYRTFLLSNNNEIHYHWICKHLQEAHGVPDNSGFFEKAYYSHEMGLRKPDARIFERVLAENQLQPNETLFIDDSPQHLETAKKLGLITILIPQASYLEILSRELGLIEF